jgi:hypothetical protein
MKRQGKRIRTLEQLAQAVAERRSVLVYGYRRHPAAAVINWQARYVWGILKSGLYLYNPKKPINPNKPPKKWSRRPAGDDTPVQPTLLLPYYPDRK